MCWYFVKHFTYIISQQLYELGNIISILYMRKQYNVITSPRAMWAADWRYDPEHSAQGRNS